MTAFRRALDFRNYHLITRVSCMNSYDKSKVENQRKKRMAEMESYLFNATHPISKLDFLHTFKHTRNKIATEEGAVMFLLPHLLTANAEKQLMQRIKDWSGLTDDKDETT